MATTTNYGWTTPDDTALVKDGAAAIRTLGSSVDTTTKALNPSTTLGDIEYRSSTANTNTRLGIGTTGQVLTVASGVPSWATAATGGMTLISTTAFSGTSTAISSIPSTYKQLKLIIVGVYGTSGADEIMRFNSDTGANYTYSRYYVSGSSGGFEFTRHATSASVGSVASQSASNEKGFKEINLYRYTDTDGVFFDFNGLSNISNTAVASHTHGVYYGSSAVSSITFSSAATYSAGNAYLYGVN
jgi:hypothetical protein